MKMKSQDEANNSALRKENPILYQVFRKLDKSAAFINANIVENENGVEIHYIMDGGKVASASYTFSDAGAESVRGDLAITAGARRAQHEHLFRELKDIVEQRGATMELCDFYVEMVIDGQIQRYAYSITGYAEFRRALEI